MRKSILLSCLILFFGQTYATTNTQFFKNHVLVFFFASTCQHCHHQAPILKDWADKHGVTVDALTMDDKPILEFPNAKPATAAIVETAFRGNNIRYPAIFVMNTKSVALYPVAIGSMSLDELNMRMQTLIPKIIAYEQGSHS